MTAKITIPRQLPIRGPRAFRFYQHLQGKPEFADFLDYLDQLDNGIQQMNRQVRDALVSNQADGTFVFDDGNNKVTIVFSKGRVPTDGITIAASTGAEATWTPA